MMSSETLRLLVTITSSEDQALFNYLSSHTGRDRNRRIRMLVRHGFALLQHECLTAALVQPSAFNKSQVDSSKTGLASRMASVSPRVLSNASFAAVERLDLDPREFAFVSEADFI